MLHDSLNGNGGNPYFIHPATIVDKQQEASNIITLRLRFNDPMQRKAFQFQAGQFNMLYVFGVGEVAISIVSDPDESTYLDHTIRLVGRVTNVLGRMGIGETLGVRGPFGQGWPMELAKGHDVMVVTGGLGCAPVVGAIEYMYRRRNDFGKIKILHGVKAPQDLLYREKFDRWRNLPETEVYLTSDEPGRSWHYHIGVVTELFEQIDFDHERTVLLMCGPEVMLRLAVNILTQRGLPTNRMFGSLERHMECGIGLCGHCQLGPYFLCKDGPILRLDKVLPFFGKEGI